MRKLACVVIAAGASFAANTYAMKPGLWEITTCPLHTITADTQRSSQEDVFWRKDGSCLPVIFTVTPMLQAGQMTGAVVAFRDMTALRQAVAALRESNEQLGGFIKTLHVVVIKDGQSRWQMINRAAERALRLADHPWPGKTNEQLASERPEFAIFHASAARSDEEAWEARQLSLHIENLADEGMPPLICEVRKMPLFGPRGERKLRRADLPGLPGNAGGRRGDVLPRTLQSTITGPP